MRNRARLLLVAVFLVATGIGARLVYLQVFCCEKLRGRAIVQQRREIDVPATRGAIVDRHGRELALSLKTESLFAHPHRVAQPESAASLLAPVIGVPRDEILQRLHSGKSFVYLHRFLEPEQAEAVRRLNLSVGQNKPFGFLPSSKRYYPRGKLGVHVVGFANIDGVGVEGIEKQFDDALRGDSTLYLVVQDGLAGRVRQEVVRAPDRKPRDVILTIDLVLQHITERELDRAMLESGARAASAILLDPASGQILALANRPTTDANRYSQAGAAARINRAVVHQYEPGSTFKIVPMAAALEHAHVRPEQRFDCEKGSYVLRNRRIRDTTPYGVLSAREVLEKSSNIGMVKITRNLKPRALLNSIERFGFGRRTGIELPGEQSGNLRPLAEWSAQTQPSLSFGYEIGVTVLQMASALAVIANDGVKVPARSVIGLRTAEGKVERFAPPAPVRVTSKRTARELGSMLEGVIIRGTGRRARVPGYRLAGKSGTAEKVVDGAYSDADIIASFGGYGPVSSPRLLGLVVLDTPRGRNNHGGQVAAPVFRRIMEEALAYLRAPADDLALAAVVDGTGGGDALRSTVRR